VSRVIFHPEARAEYRATVLYYERKARGLGAAFSAEIKQVMRWIAERPESAPPDVQGTRRKVLSRFPYTIFYAVEPDRIYVLAVTHHRRRPGYWHGRLR
jgi:plasmid stabilization system protein ParE